MRLFFEILIAVISFGFGLVLVQGILECVNYNPDQRRQRLTIPLMLLMTFTFFFAIYRVMAWAWFLWR